jgi:hypothetical protein
VSGDVTAIDTQRGRSTELDQVQTGTASIQLDNWDGRYTPGRAYGPEILPPLIGSTTATQWKPYAGISATPMSDIPTPAGYTGSNSYVLFSGPSATVGQQIAYSPRMPVKAGTPYKGSFQVRNPGSASVALSARIAFYDANGNQIVTGLDRDFAYRQYADVVRMSLPDTYHRMGAYETLTNQSNALVGVDPMVCYNVGAGASWSNYQGTGPGSGAFNAANFSVAEPCGLHIAVNSSAASSVEFWFQTTSAGPIMADYTSSGLTWYNPIAPNGAVDGTSGRLWPGLYVGTDGYLYCQASATCGAQIKSPYPVNDGMWHHYVVACNSFSPSYYLDGVLIGTDTTTAGGPFRPILGCADVTHNTTYHSGTGTPALLALPTNGFWTGNISDFAQYRQALSARDIADHYRHGSTSTFAVPPAGTGVLANRWFPLSASGVAPAGAVTASLAIQADQALTSINFGVYGASLKPVSTNYGKILPRRKVRVFSTTGQNLMPPGLNSGYQTYNAIPAGVDANETGAWVLAGGTNFSYANGVTKYSANSSSVSSLALYGPSGNGLSVPWMLIPGNTYTFTAQVAAWKFAANSTGVTIGINTTVNSAPGSSTYLNGSVTPQVISPGDTSWKTVTWTFTIPSTYQQPELLFTLYTSETLSSGSTYGWNTSIRNLQLIDVTNGQAVPAYTPGDGTMPVFQGFVDKWESLTEYDDTASVVATCSDPMRIMGDTQLPKAPQAFGFQPDWRVLGSWEMNGQTGFNAVDPNVQMVGAYFTNANATYSNMTYTPAFAASTPGFTPSALPGVFLGNGNKGATWITSPAIYLMSFGKLAAGMSTEFWFIPRQSTGDAQPGVYAAGDQYVSAMAPYFSVYASVANGGSGGFNRAWCGWGDWNAVSPVLTPGSALDVMQGGHIAIECASTGGTSPNVTVTVYYNGQLLVQSSPEALTMPAAPQFRLSGNANVAPTNHAALPPFWFELYAPASYAGTGLNWAGRLAAFKSSRVSGNWTAGQVTDGPPAQQVMPWLMGACGLARPSAQLVTGSPSTSTASLVDPPSFTSGTGLDGLNTVTQEIGGLVCMSRYSAVMIQDSAYRTDSVVPFVFSATDATSPDSSLLFLSDIDRTWTESDVTQGANTFTVQNYPAFLRYGSHRQTMTVRNADLNDTQRAVGFLASYMLPSTRCDSAQFTVINQALAALVPLVDVGSRVAFTNLPANAPTSEYFAWVESVAVSAKADGGTLVPTVTFSLSPDFAHLPIQ